MFSLATSDTDRVESRNGASISTWDLPTFTGSSQVIGLASVSSDRPDITIVGDSDMLEMTIARIALICPR